MPISLSHDLTCVRDIDAEQQLPDNPVRFDTCTMALGSEGLNSGKHSWESEVGNEPQWDVGVVKEFINRKGEITLSTAEGVWVLTLRNGNEYTAAEVTPLTQRGKPKRRQVCFFNTSDMSLIYIFKHTFTDRLSPIFLSWWKH